MCGVETEMNSDYRLDKHMKQLEELSRTAQLYYKEEQWALLERINKNIMNLTNLIKGNLEEYERNVDND